MQNPFKTNRALRIIKNPFEQVGEVLKKATKEMVKQTVQTFSPLELIKSAAGIELKSEYLKRKQQEDAEKRMKSEKNSTKLNTNKLQEQWEKTDEQKKLEMARDYFRNVSGWDKEIERRDAQRKQMSQQQQQQAQQQAQQKKQQQQQSGGAMPQGKVRKSILGGKKRKANVGMEQHTELKANASKD
ncbi:hypothetical protein HGB07_03675 [Candidatus Roizmanbacteria bacterium]|nr:hypothetical protein [Candidatus Roizmanbacteria bacterium]